MKDFTVKLIREIIGMMLITSFMFSGLLNLKAELVLAEDLSPIDNETKKMYSQYKLKLMELNRKGNLDFLIGDVTDDNVEDLIVFMDTGDVMRYIDFQ